MPENKVRGKSRTQAQAKPVILTPRQIQILRLIRDYRGAEGCSPTMQEMAERLQLSKVTIFEHVETLIGKGLLRREANRARSLTLAAGVKLSDEEGANDKARLAGQEVPRGSRGRYPLAGYIAAGRPLEAIETNEELELAELFETRQGIFVLKVRGDSMIDEQIRDGDFVLVERGQTARDGQIVVAILENGEATLKKLYREGQGFRLEGANPNFAALHVQKVAVQGVVVGVVRKY
jgi:repressor LexA